MVIDGWDPDLDWLKNLLQNAGEMPYESIYLFGATPKILENGDIKYNLTIRIYADKNCAEKKNGIYGAFFISFHN